MPNFQRHNLKDTAYRQSLRSWEPDITPSTPIGRILPPVHLDVPPKGCVHLHGSLLPKYRGAAPIQWAIIRGETETGVTLMQMDAGMDTGAMLGRRTVPIDPELTAGELHERLAPVGAEVLRGGLIALRAGTLHPE